MSRNKSTPATKSEAPEKDPATVDGWSPLGTLRDEIDRLFDDFGAGFWRRPSARSLPALAASAWPPAPAMELVECDGEYRITAEVPGMGADDVEVKLGDGTLTIRGEKSEERKEDKENYMLRERRYGAFHRSLPLPSGIDAEAIKADVANGVLTVTLPKTPEAKQKERKIEVQSA